MENKPDYMKPAGLPVDEAARMFRVCKTVNSAGHYLRQLAAHAAHDIIPHTEFYAGVAEVSTFLIQRGMQWPPQPSTTK